MDKHIGIEAADASLAVVITSCLRGLKGVVVTSCLWWARGEWDNLVGGQGGTAVQSQKAVNAYFSSKQLLPFVFAEASTTRLGGASP